MKATTRTCAYRGCRKPFTVHRKTRRFCSELCRGRERRCVTRDALAGRYSPEGIKTCRSNPGGPDVRQTKHCGDTQRKCHDCGKPISDYRCPACWAKVYRENGVTESDLREWAA